MALMWFFALCVVWLIFPLTHLITALKPAIQIQCTGMVLYRASILSGLRKPHWHAPIVFYLLQKADRAIGEQ
jgi:hypothetical protein